MGGDEDGANEVAGFKTYNEGFVLAKTIWRVK